MSNLEAVREATRIALSEAEFEADAFDALRFVRSLPHDQRSEARAAVEYVYQTGRAVPMLSAGRTRRHVAA